VRKARRRLGTSSEPTVTLSIVPVQSARELRRFIDIPWHVHDRAGERRWVPPLRMLVRDALDERRNHFYKRASRALWIAYRDGMPIGRIAAIENRAHNDFHHDRVGFFGFFECGDDAEASRALLDIAGDWLRARGLDVIRGPMNPSTNHECGLLVSGFEQHPTFMTTWNPAYYETLVEGAGFTAVKDLLGYEFPLTDPAYRLPDTLERHAARAMTRERISFRDLDTRRWSAEIALCWDVYNSAWEPNWGFVPMTREEFEQMAEGLKHLLWPHFAFGVEIDGEAAGFCLVIPDYAHVQKRIPSGRLLPFGVVKLLLGKRSLKSMRVMALGIKRPFRTAGIFALFAHELYRRCRQHGIVGAEASWILDENELMKRPLRAIGAREYRRWRIYERSLA
jgi:hypothetical protein